MSYVTVKCDACERDVILDENPYQNLVATRYWKATYIKPKDESVVKITVERHMPSINKKGKMTTRIFHEHILKTYCGPECGLEDYENERRRDS